MSNLIQHAQRELELAGLFKPDSDYGGMVGEAVMKLVRAFSDEGHSGGSAAITLAAFVRVASFKALTPPTSDPAEWLEVGEDMLPEGAKTVWQNKRQGSCFSHDGGKTYYDIDADDNRALHTSVTP